MAKFEVLSTENLNYGYFNFIIFPILYIFVIFVVSVQYEKKWQGWGKMNGNFKFSVAKKSNKLNITVQSLSSLAKFVSNMKLEDFLAEFEF